MYGDNEPHPQRDTSPMSDWRGTDFPRDREILIRLDFAVRAYWDAELQTWVLTTPVHIETVHRPREWKPICVTDTISQSASEP